MSEFDDNSFEPRFRDKSGVWSLAALSAAVFLCSVLGAKLLAQMVDRGAFDSLVAERSMRDLAKAAPVPQAPQRYSIIRSVGVDGVTTATIPLRAAPAVPPCGDAKN